MKKKKIELGGKLSVSKTVISSLNEMAAIAGGNTGASDCMICHAQTLLSVCSPHICPSAVCQTIAIPHCGGTTVITP